MKAAIQPVTLWPSIARWLSLGATHVVAYGDDGSALVTWYLLDDQERELKSGQVSITGAEYSGWGTDDEYLLTVLAQRLGLTLAT